MLGENALPAIFTVTTYTSYSSSDYNGFRPIPARPRRSSGTRRRRAVVADFTGPGRAAKLETRRFATLAEYREGDRAGRSTACSSTTTSS